MHHAMANEHLNRLRSIACALGAAQRHARSRRPATFSRCRQGDRSGVDSRTSAGDRLTTMHIHDQRTMLTPERIAVEKLGGTVVAERHAPKDSFAGDQMSTPWDALHRAYFNGEALWTYFTTPWREGAETWRALRAFFFGEDLLLRRDDYSVNVAGGFGAAPLTSDYAVANGVRLPTTRRAYTRRPDRRPILETLMVSIDISDVSFT
jgi:hypothetical protein